MPRLDEMGNSVVGGEFLGKHPPGFLVFPVETDVRGWGAKAERVDDPDHAYGVVVELVGLAALDQFDVGEARFLTNFFESRLLGGLTGLHIAGDRAPLSTVGTNELASLHNQDLTVVL